MKLSKYRAKKTEYRGHVYDSKTEAMRARDLDLLAFGGGDVESVVRQPVFHLGCPENVYRADFLVTNNAGTTWVEDVKGFETAKFKRDKRLWKRYGPHTLHILKRKGSRWEVEVIIPEGDMSAASSR